MFSQESQVMSNLKKDIEELVRSVVASIGYYAMHGKTDKEATNLAVIAVSKEIINLIESVVPEEKNRKTDDEYGYCITCNQIIDSPEADCFCTIHNLVISDIKSKLIGKE